MGLKIAREAAIFAFFLALAIALTWPLAANLEHTLSDAGDPLLNSFILDWDLHSFVHHGFNAPILYPGKYALAYSENMIGIAILMLPFAGLAPLAIHNIAMLAGFALSAYGLFVLARMITRSTIASMAGGVLYAFVPFKWDHLSHVQIISSGWLPLMLAALLAYRRRPTAFRAALFAAAFVMNGLTNIYWLLFGGFAIFVTMIFLRERRLFIAFALACAVLVPVLIPYQLVHREYRMARRSSESRAYSATVSDWFVNRHAERHLFPGIAMLLLALCGGQTFLSGRPDRNVWPTPAPLLDVAIIALLLIAVIVSLTTNRGADVPIMLAVICAIVRFWPWIGAWMQREPSAATLWIIIGVLGSFGEHAFLHSFLFRVVEPFRASRVPARWAMIAYVGLAVWAAIGAARFRKFAIVVLALAIIDVRPRIQWQSFTLPDVATYRWIAETKPRAIVELPMVGRGGLEAQYVYAETIHRVPNFCGTSGFEPPVHRMLWPMQYRDGFVDALAQHGCDLVIVHTEEAVDRAWVTRETQRGCLTLVRRIGTDEIYSITCGNRQRASRMSSSTSSTSASCGAFQLASHIGFTYGSTSMLSTR